MPSDLAPALAQAAHRQSRTARELGGVCCAWLLLFSGGVLLSLKHFGAHTDAGALAICALPPLAALALTCLNAADARRYALHLVTATLMLPILLLFWASSVDGAQPAAAERSAASLDAQALFNGADAVEDTPMQGGAIVLLRSGRFADGSELRLTRFGHAQAARDYVAMLTQAMPAEPFDDGGRHGLRLQGGSVGTTLVVIERHGADLLELRASDRNQALARLAAQRIPVPQADAEPAQMEPPARWPLLAGLAAAHALAFVALIAWAGSHLTRVPALQGALVASADELRARLLSLAQPAGPFAITAADGTAALLVDASPSPRRRQHITLRLDAGRVLVHEKLSIDGDAPQDADEASLRGPGDGLVDAARPDAQQLWSATLQATMVQPALLAAVPLRLRPRQAELPHGYAAALDGEGVLTALCAVVTRSGWHWQPRLLGRRV